MKKIAKNLKIEFVWKNVSEEVKDSVVKFWLAEGAIPKEEDAINRAKDLIAVCTSGNEVLGVATGTKTKHPAFFNNFIVYRTYVAKGNRREGIARKVFHHVYDEFNAVHEAHEIIGLLCALENPEINKNTIPVWTEDRNLTLIGFDQRGIQLRVAYFDGVEISLPKS